MECLPVMEIKNIFKTLAEALKTQAERHGFMDEPVPIFCRPLTAEEAIGRPGDQDYPILKGKEAIVEARFREARGHAFSDTYGNGEYTIRELLESVPDTNRKRADFVAALNAVYRHLGLCDMTVHCRDDEPRECARHLADIIDGGVPVLLVGFQPRMLEALAQRNPVRVVDLDADNLGKERSGVLIQGPEKMEEGIAWCSLILATGSTLVNGTLPFFLEAKKPVVFYGVTISAAAVILGLDRFCHCGH